MRRIKFRGQGVDTKEWVYGSLVSSSYLPDDILECFIVTCFAGGTELDIIKSFKVIPKTVGQYIGIKDKNRKEIYKGDILEIHPNSEDYINVEVIFYKGCFCYKNKEGGIFPFYSNVPGHNFTKFRKVIGNIYENPGLLK